MTLRLIYRYLIPILAGVILACIGISCSHCQHQAQILSDADRISNEYPDSALSILAIIDPSELTVDSLKAKYFLVRASLHDNLGHLSLSDSLIRFSADYYRSRDINRAVRSATLSALYDYWIRGDRNAIGRLDSLANLADVPDSVAIYPLRKRAYWSTKLFDEGGNRPVIKRLISIDWDSAWQQMYRYWLYCDYLYDRQNDSALMVLNGLIDESVRTKASAEQFNYEYEKLGVLEEAGKYSEALELADKFLDKAPESSVKHYIHLWKSLAHFNMGNKNLAIQELHKADSCARGISEDEKEYYNSFSYVLNTMFDFQNTGKLRLIHVAGVFNRQKDNLFRTQQLKEESEQSALISENRRLSIKAKSDRQAAMIIIIVLAGLLITGLSLWYAFNRRRKTIEAEEQAEALSKMVDELKSSATVAIDQDTARRSMIQQLGIIKMVAETPTQQNRDMLRRLSSVENGPDGTLVNWNNVYGLIDNLYSGFYSRLHKHHGSVLTDKEERIIALMVAGFSTKEISVITGQTAATIYVRKSSVRKKLGVPEKEDIVAFLQQVAND